MSNYKWVKQSERFIDLRSEDFISTSFYPVPPAMMNALLKNELYNNGIDCYIDGECCELYAIDIRVVEITAPLYEFDLDLGQYVLLSNSYTDTAIDPTQYEWIKETYLRCTKKIAKEQAEIFEKEFAEKSLDHGFSAVITISSNSCKEPYYFYEQYVPENYIKVCEKYCYSTGYRHNMVFVKKIDAKGKSVAMRVPDFYKGLVIGKGGENIKRIAKMINAKKINVI